MVFLLLIVPVTGQGAETKVALSQSFLQEKKSTEWRGIALLCDPYCRLIADKQSSSWAIVTADPLVDTTKLKFIAVDDPLFPLLYPSSTVNPDPKGKDAANGPDDGESEGKVVDEPPPYAVMAFGIGWWIDVGYQARLFSLTSSNAIGGEVGRNILAGSPTLRVGLMKGRAHKVLWNWLQHSLWASYDTTSQGQALDGELLNFDGMGLNYQMWLVFENLKTGPLFSWRRGSMNAVTDSLSQFEISTTDYLVGWTVLYHRWSFSVETLAMGEVSDGTSFRTEPIQRHYMGAGIEYCSKDLSLFDINFGLCGSFSLRKDNQKAPLASNIISSGDSEISMTNYLTRFSVRIGDDFFK